MPETDTLSPTAGGMKTKHKQNRAQRSLTSSSGVIVIAALTILTVYLFRSGHSRWAPILLLEGAMFIMLPVVLLGILRFRFDTHVKHKSLLSCVLGFQFGAFLTGFLVVAWHAAIRPFGLGEANEVIALTVLQAIAWYLAVFSKVRGFEKASFVICGSLVFFVCCLSDRIEVFLTSGLFAFVGLWWLLGLYWSRLESKAIDGDSRMLKLHGSVISLTAIVVGVVVCLAAASPLAQYGVVAKGFMPFSGGESGSESEFALSGIGDGEMLTAGNNATTTGAVDSDQFIEDHKTSLYDVMSEKYEGPVMKRKRNRAVAISGVAKHMDNVKQSEQSGRTFRTMRNSDKTTDLELKDRITNALFFVEGSVPARFPINTFDHFDGWDWSRTEDAASSKNKPQPPAITLSKQNNLPVFSLAQKMASYMTGRRAHCVKIMRLESETLPAPTFLDRWHISQVNQLDIFRWNEAGLIRFAGESLPTHSVIHCESFVPNYHLLRADHELSPRLKSRSQHHRVSPFLQLTNNVATADIDSLAANWTVGIEPGWNQVEAIVNHLRSDFDLHADWQSDEQADNTVSQFLQQGGGPTYMFATTCALALRSAGYPTRLSSGFLVQQDDYDARAQQSIVTADNLHMWPEVCLDGKFWIPVEPTPGYPVPYSTQSTWQWLSAQAYFCWNWIVTHPIQTIFFAAIVLLTVVFRAELVTSLMLLWWLLVRTFWPQSLLKTTRQLIDLRFWFAGDQRPASETISAWYARVESKTLTSFFNLWNEQNFSDRASVVSRAELVSTCRDPVTSLTLKNIRDFLSVAKETEPQ